MKCNNMSTKKINKRSDDKTINVIENSPLNSNTEEHTEGINETDDGSVEFPLEILQIFDRYLVDNRGRSVVDAINLNTTAILKLANVVSDAVSQMKK